MRIQAAEELGLVLAPRDTPNEQLRGLREGWIHWYTGSATIHPETREAYRFDETTGSFALESAVL